jgi:hypothetical protein
MLQRKHRRASPTTCRTAVLDIPPCFVRKLWVPVQSILMGIEGADCRILLIDSSDGTFVLFFGNAQMSSSWPVAGMTFLPSKLSSDTVYLTRSVGQSSSV